VTGRSRFRPSARWWLPSGLLGACAALLVSCGSSAKLIPVANSEPLQRDFEEVAHAAESSHGSCAATEAAIVKAEGDFHALPETVDAGLRRRLEEGLTKLRSDALEVCAQPAAGTTTQATTPRTTTTNTTPTNTQTTTTNTQPPTNTQTTPPATTPSGGTPAKEAEAEGEAPAGKHDHKTTDSETPSGGAGAGEGK
jgi:hypothetical protein